ncbi:MAG TPA: hypothetical protein EYP61_01470 [Candidatus Latescibacteria bacterium]|nr:hypothetical protein [Candidatus Latescibacterota bacterium]
MTLGEIYRFVLAEGMKVDPRGEEGLRKVLERRRDAYGRLEEEERARYDTERLTNPYGDLRIVHGREWTEVRGLLVGLDPGPEEVVAAEVLRNSGERVDLLVSYSTYAFPSKVSFRDVVELKGEMLSRAGVPPNRARACFPSPEPEDRRAEDLARLLDVPVLTVGSVADLSAYAFLGESLREVGRVWEVLDFLRGIGELRALGDPELLCGDVEGEVGRIYWGPISAEGFRALAEAGVGTVISEGFGLEDTGRFGMNVVKVPRYSLKSLGMNLLLDRMRRKFGEVHILPCANLVRVERDV